MAGSTPFAAAAPNAANSKKGGFAAARISAPPAPRRQGWSRTVGLLRVLLPTVALALVVLVVVWSQSRYSDSGFRIGFSQVKPEDARKLNMVNARYAGMSKSRQPYLVTSTTAVLDSPRADVIHLTSPKGDVTLKNGAWVALAAPRGDYRQKSQVLELRDGVNLFHDSGLEFNTATASLNLEDSTAVGFDPVTGHGPAAEITSAGFRVLDDGNRVIFTGKSHMTLYRKAKTRAKPARAETTKTQAGKTQGGNKR